MKVNYYNDINVDLLSFITMIYEHTRTRYNLNIMISSYNRYFNHDLNKDTLINDLNVLIDHYVNVGNNDIYFDNVNENLLILHSIIDIKVLLERVIMKQNDITDDPPKKIKSMPNKTIDKQSQSELFFQLLNQTNSAISETNNSITKTDYQKMKNILSQKTAFYHLYRERLKHQPKKHKFLPVCTDDHKFQHSMKILKYFNIKTKEKVKWEKYKNQFTSKEIECFSKNKHFLPIIVKNVTDISLGDCSYLDTCHKFQQNPNSCKYLHYFDYSPVDFTNDCKAAAEYIELEKEKDAIDPLFTFNLSNYKRSKQKPIAVNCDIRHYDFDKIQKHNYNAVIADPPWNIHMNVPNGSCNDEELFDLPLNKIHKPTINYSFADYTDKRKIYKDGGIMALWVTVRSINLGKKLLLNNGYKIGNELSWIKINQLCRTIVTGRTGHWLNHSKEHLLIGYKGNIDNWLLLRQQDLDLIVSQTRETGRKPNELYEILERLCGAHSINLELFGRENNLREGWVTLGNEV